MYSEEQGCQKEFDIDGLETELVNKKPSSDYAFTFRKIFGKDTKFKGSEVDIHAEGLRHLIRDNLPHYEGHAWDGDVVTQTAPFHYFIFNWSRLIAASENLESDSPELKEARSDLRLLLDYIKVSPDLESYFKTRESYIKSRVTTYEWIWTIFSPGTKVIASPFMGLPQMFEVRAIESSPRSRERWAVYCWSYDWNGSQLDKSIFQFKVEQFHGLKPIDTLPCYPIEFYDDKEGMKDRLFQTLISTAKRYQEICARKKGAQQMFTYEGPVLSLGIGLITKPYTKDQVIFSYETSFMKATNQVSL
jgi:hypothetical protein